MKTLAERISSLLEQVGNSPTRMAEIAGVKAPSVSDWVNGKTKSLRSGPAIRIAKHFNVNFLWLTEGRGPMSDLSPSSYSTGDSGVSESYPDELDEAPELRPGRNVPVVGEVQGGVDGYLLELEYPVGHGEGSVPYYGLDRNAYALRVRGDSMHPRYRAGEFVVVEPNIEPQPQDDVVVCLVSGQKMLKMLNWISSEEAQFLSINDGHKPLTIPLIQIEKMHRFNGHVPRSAFIKA
jgi:phage repressor protein C with HTH and peptisase S24 domain